MSNCSRLYVLLRYGGVVVDILVVRIFSFPVLSQFKCDGILESKIVVMMYSEAFFAFACVVGGVVVDILVVRIFSFPVLFEFGLNVSIIAFQDLFSIE